MSDAYIDYLHSPVGLLELTASDRGLASVHFRDTDHPIRSSPVIAQAKTQLERYFDGELTEFDLPLDMGGTAFQQSVWQQLLSIPFGATSSYSEIASRLNHPKAVRAVGAANGQNPVAIIVPCHRVIGKGGGLTGYAGGLQRKAWLLRHESREPDLWQ